LSAADLTDLIGGARTGAGTGIGTGAVGVGVIGAGANGVNVAEGRFKGEEADEMRPLDVNRDFCAGMNDDGAPAAVASVAAVVVDVGVDAGVGDGVTAGEIGAGVGADGIGRTMGMSRNLD